MSDKKSEYNESHSWRLDNQHTFPNPNLVSAVGDF